MLITEGTIRAERGSGGIAFEIGPGTTSLSVACHADEGVVAIVVVRDPAGGYVADIALGLGYFPREAYVSEARASLNATRRAPPPGAYSIIAYCIAPGGAPGGADIGIRVTVDERARELGEGDYQELPWFSPDALLLDYGRILDPEPRYYRGDLHAHTRLSDGENPARRAIEIAESRGLEFIAFTEHNRVAAGMPASRIALIPSYELTLPLGHFNVHGLARPLFNGSTLRSLGESRSFEALVDALLDYHRLDGNRSLNHPFLEPWQLRYGDLDFGRIDTVEAICDPTYPDSPAANDRAVAFLDFVWQSGYRLYGVGGSDSHMPPEARYPGAALPSIYGDPTTYAFCDGLSPAHVLQAVRSGHAYVCRRATIKPAIEADGERVLPGDRIPDHSRLVAYSVEIGDCPEGWSARFVADGRVVLEEPLTGPNSTVTFEAAADGFSWLRFGLVDEGGHQAAYVNPIYRGPRDRASGALAARFAGR